MQHVPSWRLRDSLNAAILFIASASFTLWQNTRVAVLWDLGYLLDSSYRISLGQIPYRDFPFAHAPLTFLLHAAIIHLFGRRYFPHIVCAAIEAGAATVIAWRILLHIFNSAPSCKSAQASQIECVILAKPESPSLSFIASRNNSWIIPTLLALPLPLLGIYAIYPHPIYDSDCILAVLVALFFLERAADSHLRNAAAGVLCVLPLFFKQNIGLPFLAVTIAAVLLVALVRRTQRQTIAPQVYLLAGALATVTAALLAIQLTAGLHNYFYWTITFAASRRLPGARVVLAAFRQTSLLWTTPSAIAGVILLRSARLRARRWILPTAFLLFAAPFLWTIVLLELTPDADDRADRLLSLWPHVLLLSAAFVLSSVRPLALRTVTELRLLLPVILLATIYGTFLSQQLWGSTYAIWPLLMLLIALLLTRAPALALPLAITISVTFLLCGGLYATSHERLAYIHLEQEPSAQIARATIPQLRGLSTPGPYIPAFEELIRFANTEIPAGDGILLLPGEGPFFFATGRVPQFPILLFDPATNPYTPAQTLTQTRVHNIRWLIVTRNPQLTEPPMPGLPEVLNTLRQDFVPWRTLSSYDIYRRK